MATKVLKELAVVVSTYEDRATGATKNRYKNIGVLMESTNERGEANSFLMLDRAFNPAGVMFKPGSDKILVSMFDPKSEGDGKPQGGQASGGTKRPSDDLDGDEVPF
jgi:hypothetical protein